MAACLAISLVVTAQVPPFPASAPGPIEKKIYEEWSVLSLGGKRSGFDGTVITRVETAQGIRYQTEEQEEFVVKRLGVNLKMLETSRVTEDAEGGILSFQEISQGAGSNIESSGKREGDFLVVTSRGQVGRYHIPRLAALGPAAVERFTDAIPLKANQSFSVPIFEGDYPQAAVLEQGSVIGKENHQVNGATRSLWKVVSATSLDSKMTTTTWVDDHNQDVESIVNIPGIGPIDEVVSSRAECMQQPEGAELFATSLIRPQRALPALAGLAQAYYEITAPHSSELIALWNEGDQRVLTSSPGKTDIVVTASRISPSDATWQLPHADTPELHSYLHASAYLESDSPEIKALARLAVGSEKNPVVAAHRIEKFVAAYITKKDLRIGFASAEETAKSHEGDCTEHAVLCAALGRAAGLPTRCVLGLGYIPPGADEPTISNAIGTDTGLFGFHMWAEAWIAPDRWVPMDAALGQFDVGHIAITKSALEEINPLTDLNLPILRLMENINIKVLKTIPKSAAAAAKNPGLD